YLACGYAAAYGFALAHPYSITPLIGASGAISGILGAYLVLYPRARVWSLVPFLLFLPLRIPAWFVLGLWFLLQWAYSAGMAPPGRGLGSLPAPRFRLPRWCPRRPGHASHRQPVRPGVSPPASSPVAQPQTRTP